MRRFSILIYGGLIWFLVAGCQSTSEGAGGEADQGVAPQVPGSGDAKPSTTMGRQNGGGMAPPTADQTPGRAGEPMSGGIATAPTGAGGAPVAPRGGRETGSGDEGGTVEMSADAGVEEPMGGEPAPGMPPENLVEDPSFEAGSERWSIWGGAERSEGDAHDGQFAVRMTSQNGAEQRVTLLPNRIYRLSGWAKTTGTEPVLIGVKYHGADEKRAVFDSPEYASKSIVFQTSFGTTDAVIYVYKHGADGVGHADNVSLTLEGETDYRLIWSDEFDGSGPVDSEKWSFEEGFLRNEELQWYQPDNAVREDGLLVIEGREERRANPNYEAGSNSWKTNREFIEYTSSSMKTEGLFDWQYGRLVVRAKVTNFTGTWPAIWTLGVNCEWPSNGEIDVMENYGGKILANFAWGTNRRWTPRWDSFNVPVSDLGEGWTSRFHIWELDWTENQMRILLDGRVLNTVNLNETVNGPAKCEGQNPFRQRHYLLLNLALGGAGGSVERLQFPTRYLVDYVRVYQTGNAP